MDFSKEYLYKLTRQDLKVFLFLLLTKGFERYLKPI